MLLYVHRDHKDGHLDFHIAPELCSTVPEELQVNGSRPWYGKMFSIPCVRWTLPTRKSYACAPLRPTGEGRTNVFVSVPSFKNYRYSLALQTLQLSEIQSLLQARRNISCCPGRSLRSPLLFTLSNRFRGSQKVSQCDSHNDRLKHRVAVSYWRLMIDQRKAAN